RRSQSSRHRGTPPANSGPHTARPQSPRAHGRDVSVLRPTGIARCGRLTYTAVVLFFEDMRKPPDPTKFTRRAERAHGLASVVVGMAEEDAKRLVESGGCRWRLYYLRRGHSGPYR